MDIATKLKISSIILPTTASGLLLLLAILLRWPVLSLLAVTVLWVAGWAGAMGIETKFKVWCGLAFIAAGVLFLVLSVLFRRDIFFIATSALPLLYGWFLIRDYRHYHPKQSFPYGPSLRSKRRR